MNIVSVYILCEGDSVAVVCDNCNSFTLFHIMTLAQFTFSMIKLIV